ncbi:uncharacterized protein LOC110860182 [Folsomia candida]|uniref:uncharacterized protein LOC110860182 n=1 Tax=Folsomia candida TaxID=158441 RepID=UPI000B8F309D|nr:uncharacterized protein LOC110860182 [Folsomia candida]
MLPYWISILLTLSFATASNGWPLEELIRNGTKLEWTYHRGGVKYYMTPDMTADVIDSARQRFNATHTISDGSSTTSIRPSTTQPTMPGTTTPSPEMMETVFQIDVLRYVSLVGNVLKDQATRTTFKLIPVEGGDNQFHLFYNGDTFVAPRTRPPFELGAIIPGQL